MAKKSARKKGTGKVSVHHENPNVEKALIENFISLQKVMTNLSVSFDSLSDKIAKLLELFELSAKTLSEKDFNAGKKLNKEEEISKKLDALVDQNKIIARGLTLLHESGQEGESYQPRAEIPQQKIGVNIGNEYQKSISANAKP